MAYSYYHFKVQGNIIIPEGQFKLQPAVTEAVYKSCKNNKHNHRKT